MFTCSNPECDVEIERKTDLVEGSYCSESCYNRHKGAKLLRNIEHTHTHCASCGRELKEVEPPTSLHPDFVIGFQYRTQHAEMGEKTVLFGDNEFNTTGTICGECGTTDQQDKYMREFYFRDFIENTLKYLRGEYRSGGLEKYINERVFFNTMNEGFSLEYALGKAYHHNN